jgi:hypothetical protein
VIIFGIILLVIGLIAGIALLQTLGILIALVGVALLIMGRMGRAVGGRSHYW